MKTKTIWEKFLGLAKRLKLDGVHCDFYFEGSSEEVYEKFKKTFNIKADVPDYVKKYSELYEVGDGKFQGMNIKVYGVSKQNPNFVPLSKKWSYYRICPECKEEIPTPIINKGVEWCCQCGYVLEGKLRIDRQDHIRIIMDWEFTDKNGETHKVVALQVNNTIFHYGKDGLRTVR